MKFFRQFFSWWSGQTLNTRFFTWRRGQFAGRDEAGNTYYRAPSAIPDSIPERRWVIYNGYSEASAVPPGWHAWLHNRTDTPPVDQDYVAHAWEKPHVPNLTGTAFAYRPPGSIVGANRPQPTPPDYEAWKPE